jgi:hypothetical protein
MVSTLTAIGRAPGAAASRGAALRLGLVLGAWLLVLPLLVAAFLLVSPSMSVVARISSAEALVLAAAQILVACRLVRRDPSLGLGRVILAVVVAGAVVSVGDVLVFAQLYDVPASKLIVPIAAYDLVLGPVLALPIVVVAQAFSRRRALRPVEIAESSDELIGAYQRVLADCSPSWRSRDPWRPLTHQLVRQHIRRTLEPVQREYASRSVGSRLDEGAQVWRSRLDDFLLSVAPISKLVPIPTVATVFVLWKAVPPVVTVAAAAATWFGGQGLEAGPLLGSLGDAVPEDAAGLIVDGLALATALTLLMVVLAPAILRRDRLLSANLVCEHEAVLLRSLGLPRSSRRVEYLMAALPAVPFAAYGAVVLAYSLAGLWTYPAPQGPLHSLVARTESMGLGPLTGAVLAQAFIFGAACWFAWIVGTRRTTRTALT